MEGNGRKRVIAEAWAVRLILFTIISVLTWSVQRVMAHEVWMAEKAGIIYTVKDSIVDRAELTKQLNLIYKELAGIKQEIVRLESRR